MPRTLKRRSEVISNNNHDAASSDDDGPPTRRRRRHSSSSAASAANSPSSNPSDDDNDADHTQVDVDGQSQQQQQQLLQVLIKKLVRLALSTEYARLPLRRGDISQKILKDNHASPRLFRAVFAGAQQTLAKTFGMTLVELPTREKTSLKDRRTQATQQQSQKQQSQSQQLKSWILVSTLPAKYQRDRTICPPTKASSQATEAEYTALYTFVISLIYLNNSVLTDAKLERYLKRVNADNFTPVGGATDKLLQRMVREGYVDKKRDLSSGEEVVEWVVGPRGKVEVGVRAVADLVKGVYGFGSKNNNNNNKARGGQRQNSNDNDNDSDREDGDGDEDDDSNEKRQGGVKIEEDELNRRLERSLGIKISSLSSSTIKDGAAEQQQHQQQQQQQQQETEQMDIDAEEADEVGGNRRNAAARQRQQQQQQQQKTRKKGGRPRRGQDHSDDDDDDDEESD